MDIISIFIGLHLWASNSVVTLLHLIFINRKPSLILIKIEIITIYYML
jgi:hypothetical protein